MPAVLIDDLGHAASFWPKPWRARLQPRLAALAVGVRLMLHESGWIIAPYAQFPRWLNRRGRDFTFVSLDKLLPAGRGPASAFMDLSRSYNQCGDLVWDFDCLRGALSTQTRVALIDDAAYSSQTIELAAATLDRMGITVSHAFVCAAKAGIPAREACVGRFPLSAMIEAPPGWDITHFRDFFCLVPFSGRRLFPLGAPDAQAFRHAGVLHQCARMLALQTCPDLQGVVVRANLALIKELLREFGMEEADRAISESDGVVAWPVADEDTGAPPASIRAFAMRLETWLEANSK
jgi:hypothetical protein